MVFANRITSRARVSLRASGLALLTIVQLGAVEAHERIASEARRPAIFDRHMRAWVRTLLRMFGVRVNQSPTTPPTQRAKARLVVCNHRSPIDIAVMLSIFGGQVLSREDLGRWPILGRAARKAGTIFVDRDQSASGAKAIREIQRRLKAGATLIVFPEGTTFAGDEVRTFRLGAFVGLKNVDVEVVPVGLAYEPGVEFVDETFLQHLDRIAARSRTRVSVCIGAPVPAEGRAAELGERLHEEVQTLVHKARIRQDAS
jgi:1-acyl-sn-glycerol-3-phosphate acyltransferase